VGTLAAHEFTVAARRYHLRLVEQWPWQTQLNQAPRRVRAIPLRI
jgi:hypothetical protein